MTSVPNEKRFTVIQFGGLLTAAALVGVFAASVFGGPSKPVATSRTGVARPASAVAQTPAAVPSAVAAPAVAGTSANGIARSAAPAPATAAAVPSVAPAPTGGVSLGSSKATSGPAQVTSSVMAHARTSTHGLSPSAARAATVGAGTSGTVGAGTSAAVPGAQSAATRGAGVTLAPRAVPGSSAVGTGAPQAATDTTPTDTTPTDTTPTDTTPTDTMPPIDEGYLEGLGFTLQQGLWIPPGSSLQGVTGAAPNPLQDYGYGKGVWGPEQTGGRGYIVAPGAQPPTGATDGPVLQLQAGQGAVLVGDHYVAYGGLAGVPGSGTGSTG